MTQGVGYTFFRETLPFPEQIDGVSLATTSEETYTVPTGVNFVELCGSLGFYARLNATAAAITDITDGTASRYCAAGDAHRFKVSPGDVIHLIRQDATTTTNVSISRYSV